VSEIARGIPDYPFANPAPLTPPAEWAELRRTCPVSRVRLPSGDEAVTKITKKWIVNSVAIRYPHTETLSSTRSAGGADPRCHRGRSSKLASARVQQREDPIQGRGNTKAWRHRRHARRL